MDLNVNKTIFLKNAKTEPQTRSRPLPLHLHSHSLYTKHSYHLTLHDRLKTVP